jgi:mRNA interferase MazF
MKFGKKYNFGDIIIAEVQFTDTFEIKKRPALVLFEEYNNIVAAVITSNPQMKGIPITKKDGMLTDSIIKLNYIFTISEKMVSKYLLKLPEEKKKIIKEELFSKLI